MDLRRILKHLLGGPWQARRAFPRDSLARIEKAIHESERSHSGELRFVVEAVLPWSQVLRGVSARQRAIELFSALRVWDTAHNSGVLIYLLLADHDVEIVADRGIHDRVGEAGWQAICGEMEAQFRAGRFEQGVLHGLARIGALQRRHFPVDMTTPHENELPDAPLLM